MKTGHTFRYIIGIIAVIGGLGGLYTLFFVEVPTGNRDALMLALGVVLGWGGSVIQGEWGSSPGGRELAKVGAQALANEPRPVEVVNSPADPVPTKPAFSDGGI